MNSGADMSPVTRARVAGGLYLLTTIGGIFDEMVRSDLVVRGDAGATARHILGSASLYLCAVAAEFIAGACYIGVTVILYGLLRPVSRTGSLAAAFFSLAGVATGGATICLLMAPIVLLGGDPYLSVFTPDQLRALALAALRVHVHGYNFGMIFFGVYCALLGVLAFRSGFWPRWLGALLVLGGLSELTDSLAYLLAPAFDQAIDPWIEAPGFIGEAGLCLWLLAVGVNGERWDAAQARTIA